MPLNVIVVGAGIAGLTAADSLREAGHTVRIFEKSKFAAEVGAAAILSPNAGPILSKIGFSIEKAGAYKLTAWETVDGITLARLGRVDHRDSEQKYGSPFFAVHRVDLHNELLRLIGLQDEHRPACELHLRSKVVDVNPEQGMIELEDGTRHYADLIVAADGVHSTIRSIVLGSRDSVTKKTGIGAFRLLIPTANLVEQESVDNLRHWKSATSSTIFADTQDKVNERHMVWYECQGGEIQNIENFLRLASLTASSRLNLLATFGSRERKAIKLAMLREFGHFHPTLLDLIKLAPEITYWELSSHDPLQRWTYGKVLLIGDAAHAMLPFGGQGSNQAIEDGGALGYLMRDVHSQTEVPKRLALFEQVRVKRASRVQILSKARVGLEKSVEQELKQYAEPPGSDVPTSHAERTMHDFKFNVYEKCDQILASQGMSF